MAHELDRLKARIALAQMEFADKAGKLLAVNLIVDRECALDAEQHVDVDLQANVGIAGHLFGVAQKLATDTGLLCIEHQHACPDGQADSNDKGKHGPSPHLVRSAKVAASEPGRVS